MPTIYQDMKDAGLVEGNRYSDLYVFDTPRAWEIIGAHQMKAMAHRFKSNIDGRWLIELPLCYDPYWEKSSA
jgi:hypothetical protein